MVGWALVLEEEVGVVDCCIGLVVEVLKKIDCEERVERLEKTREWGEQGEQWDIMNGWRVH